MGISTGISAEKQAPRREFDPLTGSELDTPEAIEAAKEYLEREYPSISGCGEHYFAAKIAKRVIDHALSQEVAHDLMLGHWNDRCLPEPWAVDDIERFTTNAAEARTAEHEAFLADLSEATDAEIAEAEKWGLFVPPAFKKRKRADNNNTVANDDDSAVVNGDNDDIPSDLFDGAGYEGKCRQDKIGRPPKEFVFGGFGQVGEVGILVGRGGAGKTQLVLQSAAAMAVGRRLLGQGESAEPAVSFGIIVEDCEGELAERIDFITDAMGLSRDEAMLKANMRFVTMATPPPNLPEKTSPAFWTKGKPTRLAKMTFKAIEAAIANGDNVKQLTLDNSAALFLGSENVREEVTPFMQYLSRQANRLNICIILLMHPSKSSAELMYDKASGSNAFGNSARFAVWLGTPDEPGGDQPLEHIKVNNQAPKKMAVRMHNLFFVPVTEGEERTGDKEFIEFIRGPMGKPKEPQYSVHANQDNCLQKAWVRHKHPSYKEAKSAPGAQPTAWETAGKNAKERANRLKQSGILAHIPRPGYRHDRAGLVWCVVDPMEGVEEHPFPGDDEADATGEHSNYDAPNNSPDPENASQSDSAGTAKAGSGDLRQVGAPTH